MGSECGVCPDHQYYDDQQNICLNCEGTAVPNSNQNGCGKIKNQIISIQLTAKTIIIPSKWGVSVECVTKTRFMIPTLSIAFLAETHQFLTK